MMLPDRFQFRHNSNPGFTHSAKVEGGIVTVKWARGWHEDVFRRTNEPVIACIYPKHLVENAIQDQQWDIVDQPETKQEGALPDESLSTKAAPQLPSVFYFRHFSKDIEGINKAVLVGDEYQVYWEKSDSNSVSKEMAGKIVEHGFWQIIDKRPLTAEQQRANAEAREQIAALEHNIKLRNQDIEHAQILIANYESRVKELEGKIVEGF